MKERNQQARKEEGNKEGRKERNQEARKKEIKKEGRKEYRKKIIIYARISPNWSTFSQI